MVHAGSSIAYYGCNKGSETVDVDLRMCACDITVSHVL